MRRLLGSALHRCWFCHSNQAFWTPHRRIRRSRQRTSVQWEKWWLTLTSRVWDVPSLRKQMFWHLRLQGYQPQSKRRQAMIYGRHHTRDCGHRCTFTRSISFLERLWCLPRRVDKRCLAPSQNRVPGGNTISYVLLVCVVVAWTPRIARLSQNMAAVHLGPLRRRPHCPFFVHRNILIGEPWKDRLMVSRRRSRMLLSILIHLESKFWRNQNRNGLTLGIWNSWGQWALFKGFIYSINKRAARIMINWLALNKVPRRPYLLGCGTILCELVKASCIRQGRLNGG